MQFLCKGPILYVLLATRQAWSHHAQSPQKQEHCTSTACDSVQLYRRMIVVGIVVGQTNEISLLGMHRAMRTYIFAVLIFQDITIYNASVSKAL